MPMSEPLAESKPPETHGATTPAKTPSKLRRRVLLGAKIMGGLLVLWLIAAYVILPAMWRHYEHHPVLATAPKTTLTGQGIPGDPLNVGLIGGEEDVVKSMLAADWSPADPITLRSSLRIAASVVFRRPDPNAPVSNLYLFGRKQDLAFEKPVGGNARQRHHVRFWKSDKLGRAGVPLFIGSATFDMKVGLSRDTGEVTHNISPDIDAQRDELIADLVKAGRIAKIYQVTGLGATLFGRNGEGDRYFTDGELSVGVLAPQSTDSDQPEVLANPPLVRMKDQLWTAVRPLLDDSTP
jgi:LssY C-terminus